jgi:hypothetical protein
MWVVFRTHYGRSYNQFDSDPTTFSDLVFFSDEVSALRFATRHHREVVHIPDTTPEAGISFTELRS